VSWLHVCLHVLHVYYQCYLLSTMHVQPADVVQLY
jgi:hypothetical protein